LALVQAILGTVSPDDEADFLFRRVMEYLNFVDDGQQVGVKSGKTKSRARRWSFESFSSLFHCDMIIIPHRFLQISGGENLGKLGSQDFCTAQMIRKLRNDFDTDHWQSASRDGNRFHENA
jgi:hypothetical protein